MAYILIVCGDPVGVYSSFAAAEQGAYKSVHKSNVPKSKIEIMAVPYYGEG